MSTPTPFEPVQDSRRRVLYVDDDETLRKVVRMFLEDNGYWVETAEDGKDAWIRLCSAMTGLAKGFDLVITDLDMPNLDGFEFIRAVRKVGFNVPIMVYTGKLSPERRQALTTLGVEVAVEKGGESASLVKLIRDLAMGNGVR